ncbi:TetR/AcrR family transcriptional regulator [Glycomyces sp. L485]|uniref:TetR/AcrR family transcriptional regulator n=1 Tax=Glycomyces sp. L485 TaxID=2909235 RepID=UPI0024079F4F|nr:TetR/AcrR family transcriptional regulator [Glycomyces sp. L485]
MTERPRRRVGRPRVAPEDDGAEPREQILAAAAELFTTQGYTATSTRAITAKAGLRQASMYYYFASKEELLRTLLETTVAPSLEFARWALTEREAMAEARLWALTRIDAAQLAGARHNLGALYLLPEVRRPAFESFRDLRDRLRDTYKQLLSQTAAGLLYTPGELHQRSRLVFGLVEGVILARQDNATVSDPVCFSADVADGAMRLADVGDMSEARKQGMSLCADWLGRSAHYSGHGEDEAGGE